MSAKKRSFLSDELADLFNPAPKTELDPDELGDEDKGLGVGSEWNVDPHHTVAKQAGEKGLHMRGDIALDGAEYRGRRTSRAKMFEEEGNDEDDDADEDGDVMLGSGDDEEGEHDDGDDDEMEGGKVMDGLDKGGEGSDESESESDDDDDDDDDDEDVKELDLSNLDGGLKKSIEDANMGKLDELEREYDELQREDADAVVSLRQKSAKERTKGMAVRSQQTLYERSLESRILMQRVVQGSLRMPNAEIVKGIHQSSEKDDNVAQLKRGLSELCDEAVQTLSQLLDLQEALIDRNSGIEKAEELHQSELQTSADIWRRMERATKRFSPYRDVSIDRWHRRTVLSSGASALRNSMRALNQSVSSQVSAIMKDPTKFVERTRLTVSGRPRMLCSPADEPSSQGADMEVDADNEKDANTYDDGEFYQQLLREFLERGGGGAATGAVLQRKSKRRKVVDRRASKGRKVRYEVMEKMVGFMPPSEMEVPAFAPQLFANLFGHPGQ